MPLPRPAGFFLAFMGPFPSSHYGSHLCASSFSARPSGTEAPPTSLHFLTVYPTLRNGSSMKARTFVCVVLLLSLQPLEHYLIHQ